MAAFRFNPEGRFFVSAGGLSPTPPGSSLRIAGSVSHTSMVS